MTKYSNVFDSETIGSGGGFSEAEVECFKQNTLTVQVIGDSNSTKVDLLVKGRLDQKDDFGVYASNTGNQDLTSDRNKSRLYTFDVSDLNDAKIKVVNNAGSDTVVDVVVGVSENVEG